VPGNDRRPLGLERPGRGRAALPHERRQQDCSGRLEGGSVPKLAKLAAMAPVWGVSHFKRRQEAVEPDQHEGTGQRK